MEITGNTDITTYCYFNVVVNGDEYLSSLSCWDEVLDAFNSEIEEFTTNQVLVEIYKVEVYRQSLEDEMITSTLVAKQDFNRIIFEETEFKDTTEQEKEMQNNTTTEMVLKTKYELPKTELKKILVDNKLTYKDDNITIKEGAKKGQPKTYSQLNREEMIERITKHGLEHLVMKEKTSKSNTPKSTPEPSEPSTPPSEPMEVDDDDKESDFVAEVLGVKKNIQMTNSVYEKKLAEMKAFYERLMIEKDKTISELQFENYQLKNK